jgi:hypothetical protein
LALHVKPDVRPAPERPPRRDASRRDASHERRRRKPR